MPLRTVKNAKKARRDGRGSAAAVAERAPKRTSGRGRAPTPPTAQRTRSSGRSSGRAAGLVRVARQRAPVNKSIVEVDTVAAAAAAAAAAVPIAVDDDDDAHVTIVYDRTIYAADAQAALSVAEAAVVAAEAVRDSISGTCSDFRYGVDVNLHAHEITDGAPGRRTDGVEYTKSHTSGWTITGTYREDYYTWVEHFMAIHPQLGYVSGDFDDVIEASSHAAYDHFMAHHPPNHWDRGDI
jgi:hypothetical protein